MLCRCYLNPTPFTLTHFLKRLTNFRSLYLLLLSLVDSKFDFYGACRQEPTFQQGTICTPLEIQDALATVICSCKCTTSSLLCRNLAQRRIIFAPNFTIRCQTMPHHSPSLPPISHFGVSRGFDFLLMTPGGTALYIRARVRDDQKMPTKSILAFQKGLFTLGRQIKKNIHI